MNLETLMSKNQVTHQIDVEKITPTSFYSFLHARYFNIPLTFLI